MRIWKLREMFVAGCKKKVQHAATDNTDEVVVIGEFRIDMRTQIATLRGELLELTEVSQITAIAA
jgi:hypothetical protein